RDGRHEEGAVGRARDGAHRRLPRRCAAPGVDVGPPRPRGGPPGVRREARGELGRARPVNASDPATGPPLPLQGVRVLALEQMIAAPWATQMLTRLGADVIKVEHPERGESGRASVPFVTDPQGRRVGATFLRNNLNKRSVGIDLTRGADLVLALAEHCDVFVQNFKAGTLDRKGLGYAEASARNPSIIYVSVTGFGTTTAPPYEGRPAYASIAEAMSGACGWGRQPGRRPVVNPVGGLGDIGSGMFAVMGILAALL